VSKSHLALILHAHLPFVRHPEHEHFLEEDWFFEAITESYIPLLQTMQRLVNDGVPFKLTMSITPTLTAMLQDELLRQRYLQHVDLLIDLAAREQQRNRKDARLKELADFYFALFSETRQFFRDGCKCDLLAPFRQLRRAGVLEIIASAATHGLLPLLEQQSYEGARAQVLIGCDEYVNLWSEEPKGFWLPECAYAPDLDCNLQEANIRWFVLDAHGLLFGNPQPRRAIFAPCYTRAGPAAFARDRNSSRQVWSAREGYPGDPAYREFYRDVGFDLPLEHLGPVGSGMRRFSGLKYHRITGRGAEKELYDRAAAERRAETHAAHFLEQRRAELRRLSQPDAEAIVVIPFDAELFGHWWFEGPLFLERFIRKTASEQDDFCLTTPTEHLAAHPTQQIIEPARSTWGENGDLSVWINPVNAWIYPHLHGAARRMTEVARRFSAIVGRARRLPNAKTADGAPVLQCADRVLQQLARELLLSQSSDWAFLMKTATAREYATKRTLDHLGRFNRLHDQLIANHVDEEFLRECECRDNLFPDVNWRYYA
jgi:1,4-alpha-glucan branching enzyme